MSRSPLRPRFTAFEQGDFGGDEADIVREFGVRVGPDFREEFVKEFVGRKKNPILDRGEKTVLAEFLLSLIVDFEQAVGEEQQNVVGLERTMAHRILRLLEKAEGKVWWSGGGQAGSTRSNKIDFSDYDLVDDFELNEIL